MDTHTTTDAQQSKGRSFRGTVVATKMQGTVTVAVERYVKHPKYKKYVRQTKKYLVHNPGADVNVGDAVVIAESKPISKRKHFTLVV